jgi:hypothetical protein
MMSPTYLCQTLVCGFVGNPHTSREACAQTVFPIRRLAQASALYNKSILV